jgi:predicted GTPase
MSIRFILIMLAIFILPFLIIMGLGGYWLWQHEWLYQAIGVLSANSVLIYALIRHRSQQIKSKKTKPSIVSPNPNWTDDDQQAWKALETVTERWKNEPDLFTNSTKAARLTNDVLTTVAKHFHVNSSYPILEFPLPYLLKLITLVFNDIQNDVFNKIPGSHAVTVGDFLRAKDTFNKFNNIKSFFNAGNLLFNWQGVFLSKARGMLLDKGINFVTDEISQRLVITYVNKLGYYAIQLYSGQITLDDIVPTDVLTPYSKTDIKESAENEKTIEPLRLLILGQVNSGKSSLINAFFDDVKSATSVLPTTAEITPYVLERDGLQQAIILDSTGYGGLTHDVLPESLKKEWAKIDIILMMCSASNAARNSDIQQLNTIRSYFQQEQQLSMPVIIAVATHIDRLRPIQEWQPPYNIQQPENPKAKNIRSFCEVISSELNLPLENIVPVCLNPEIGIYNIEDGLMLIIHEHLNEAQRVRYLRCLRHQQNQSYWRQWREQALGLGKIFFS